MSDEEPQPTTVADAAPAEETTPAEATHADDAGEGQPSGAVADAPTTDNVGADVAAGVDVDGGGGASLEAVTQQSGAGDESGAPAPPPPVVAAPPADPASDAAHLLANIGGDAAATLMVRFTVRPEGFYVLQPFPPTAPALSMYARLETQLRVERRQLRLYWEGRPLTDMDVISDVCVIPDDDSPLVVDVEFDELPEHLRILGAGEQAVRSIGVDVHYGDDIPSKEFFVTLVKGYERKPFLGGFRNKKTEALFHHATTQCHVEREIRTNLTNKLTRMTQTQGVTRSCQTMRECATQMPRSDLLVDETYDRIVVAKPYFSAEKLLALQVQKTIQLQAYVRGWRARKIAQRLRRERDEEELMLISENEARKAAHNEKRMKEIARRTHPRNPQDFAVLYNELEAWRIQEVQRIHDAPISDADKRLASQELLKKETKLLQTIDRLQIQASKENKVHRINAVLNKMSSAKSWGTQSAVNVETPFTIRARELRDLYNGLRLDGLTVDERLDILLHVKWTVKEFSCPLTREIVELVDREADLLNRGRKDHSLIALRQRMSNLFLQFVETPEFNPEAVQYQRVPLEYNSRPLVRLDKKR